MVGNTSFTLDEVLSSATQLPDFHCSQDIVTSFTVLCKLMTQFASFPVYKTGVANQMLIDNSWSIVVVVAASNLCNTIIQKMTSAPVM